MCWYVLEWSMLYVLAPRVSTECSRIYVCYINATTYIIHTMINKIKHACMVAGQHHSVQNSPIHWYMYIHHAHNYAHTHTFTKHVHVSMYACTLNHVLDPRKHQPVQSYYRIHGDMVSTVCDTRWGEGGVMVFSKGREVPLPLWNPVVATLGCLHMSGRNDFLLFFFFVCSCSASLATNSCVPAPVPCVLLQ